MNFHSAHYKQSWLKYSTSFFLKSQNIEKEQVERKGKDFDGTDKKILKRLITTEREKNIFLLVIQTNDTVLDYIKSKSFHRIVFAC